VAGLRDRATAVPPRGTRSGRLRERPLLVIITTGILLVASLIIILAVLVALYRWLSERAIFYPEFALPMLLLAAIVVFFGGIAVLVNVYRSVGLHDKRHALGLPEGSVRAIIALILIFLFFVAMTFIYFSVVRGQPNRMLRGLTPAQFTQIPASEIISSTPIPATGTPTSYNVVIQGSVPTAAEDIGKNVIIILGTLVTAVASFYFGSKSATSAAVAGAQIRAGGITPPIPHVTGIAPGGGPTVGGTAVTLTGSGFSGATAVNFGTEPATDFTSNSETQITAESPPGTGTADVTVTTPAGVSVASPAAEFTYSSDPPPQASDVRPSSGPAQGGTSVVLNGSGFTGATAVHFGPNPAPNFTTDSDTQITAVSPAGTGTVAITVTTPAGPAATQPQGQFTYSQ
jgi:IPT/TIG domain